MSTLNEAQTWRGRVVQGPDGEKVGSVEDVYLDRQTGEPEWLAVKTGLFGSNISFVPLQGSSSEGDSVRIRYDKQLVRDAPNFDPDGRLSPEEERALYEHYGRGDYQEYARPDFDAAQTTGVTAQPGTVGRDSGGPAGDAMTRPPDEPHVGTQRERVGRARLRRYVVTESVTQTVSVQREEVRIEGGPITEGTVDQPPDGPAIPAPGRR